jgi:hypothetical protein
VARTAEANGFKIRKGRVDILVAADTQAVSKCIGVEGNPGALEI